MEYSSLEAINGVEEVREGPSPRGFSGVGKGVLAEDAGPT